MSKVEAEDDPMSEDSASDPGPDSDDNWSLGTETQEESEFASTTQRTIVEIARLKKNSLLIDRRWFTTAVSFYDTMKKYFGIPDTPNTGYVGIALALIIKAQSKDFAPNWEEELCDAVGVEEARLAPVLKDRFGVTNLEALKVFLGVDFAQLKRAVQHFRDPVFGRGKDHGPLSTLQQKTRFYYAYLDLTQTLGAFMNPKAARFISVLSMYPWAGQSVSPSATPSSKLKVDDYVVDEATNLVFCVCEEKGKGRGITYFGSVDDAHFWDLESVNTDHKIKNGDPVCWFRGTEVHRDSTKERDEYNKIDQDENDWRHDYAVNIADGVYLVPKDATSPADIDCLAFLINTHEEKRQTNTRFVSDIGGSNIDAYVVATKEIRSGDELCAYYAPGYVKDRKHKWSSSSGSKQ